MFIIIAILLLILFSVSPRISSGTGWFVFMGVLLTALIVHIS
jgi:uncharacterized membrane protein YbjE (DUF340 family)